jgi:hypothetical protein
MLMRPRTPARRQVVEKLCALKGRYSWEGGAEMLRDVHGSGHLLERRDVRRGSTVSELPI